MLKELAEGVVTSSPEETRLWARRLAEQLPLESILALHGDLGVGKSTFVGGLAEAWGIESPITSPTFNVFHLYEGTRRLIHMDAYRLNHEADMDTLMIEDFLTSPYCLAIEWAERIAAWLPEDVWHLYLSIVKPGVHRIVLNRRILTQA